MGKITIDKERCKGCGLCVLNCPKKILVISETESNRNGYFVVKMTDETACITGSMGLQPSASLGEHTPLFEPVHGSWPQAAGQNIANPLAQILSAAMLLEHFGLEKEGALVREAVNASLDANVRTPEIQVEGGAKYGTREVGEWIVDYIMRK